MWDEPTTVTLGRDETLGRKINIRPGPYEDVGLHYLDATQLRSIRDAHERVGEPALSRWGEARNT